MKVYIIDKFYELADPPRPYACVSSTEQMEAIIKELKAIEPEAHTVYRIAEIKTLSPDKGEYLISEENGEWTAKQVCDLPLTLCPQIRIEEEGYLVYESSPEAAIEAAKRRMGKTNKAFQEKVKHHGYKNDKYSTEED